MTEQSAAPGADSGALSVDQAAGLLLAVPAAAGGTPPKKDQAAAGEPAAEHEIPADPEAEEADDAQPEEAASDAGEGEGDVEPEEPDEGDDPAIEAPTSWDAEAKALFAQLPKELQGKLSEYQQQRDAQTGQAQQRAAETARRAEAEIAQFGRTKAALDQLLPHAQQVFRGRWEGIDWAAWSQDDPIAAFQGKQAMEAEQAELQRLSAAQQQVQKQAYDRFLVVEEQKLAQVAPDLADAQKGPKLRAELQSYLVGAGIPAAALDHADATQLSIAYKAMRYDQLQAQAKAQLARKPTTPPAKPGLKPGAPAGGSPKTRAVQAAANRFAQTKSVDAAVELLLARG
jgi:hypothetical protein